MRFIITLIAAFLFLTPPAFSQLTAQDLEKIRAIVNEEVNASETKMKEYISQEIKAVNIKIDELDKRFSSEIRGLDERLTTEIRGLDKRLGFVENLMIALISAIVVALGVPSILIAFLLKKQRAEYERIEAQQKQIDTLRQEIEIYKQKQIVSP